jgi:hypothetical protein
MEVSKNEARESLAEIERIVDLTRRSIGRGCAAPLLILWGIIWVIGYSGTQFYPRYAGFLWLGLITIGSAFSWVAGVRFQTPVRSPSDAKIGFFWLILFGYAIVWLFLLGGNSLPKGEEWLRRHPLQSQQISAYFATIPMFAYVVGGLWLGRFFIYLGLIVTALTLVGYMFLPDWFNLWMAITGGGSLIIAGLFIRKFWR